jgi:PucR C-terminal helix-turn-helix domain
VPCESVVLRSYGDKAMTYKRVDLGSPSAGARAELADRLRRGREELAIAMLECVRAAPGVSDDDPTYRAGQAETVTAILDDCLVLIENEGWVGPVPPAAITHAARAAWVGVELSTIVCRYIAGQGLLQRAIIDELASELFVDATSVLRQVLTELSKFMERIVASIVAEYASESARAVNTRGRRLQMTVRELIKGECDSVNVLNGYVIDGRWHLGIVVTAQRSQQIIDRLKSAVDCTTLVVSPNKEVSWIWLGSRQRLEVDVSRLLPVAPAGAAVAVGEPGYALAGWRLTHMQAQEALHVALCHPREKTTRYADVALLLPWLRDPARTRSLLEIYLGPLDDQRDGGIASRQTLRAYFDARRNTSSAAVALDVSRQTVENRIHTIERKLGRLLHTCLAELEVALRLEEIEAQSSPFAYSP